MSDTSASASDVRAQRARLVQHGWGFGAPPRPLRVPGGELRERGCGSENCVPLWSDPPKPWSERCSHREGTTVIFRDRRTGAQSASRFDQPVQRCGAQSNSGVSQRGRKGSGGDFDPPSSASGQGSLYSSGGAITSPEAVSSSIAVAEVPSKAMPGDQPRQQRSRGW